MTRIVFDGLTMQAVGHAGYAAMGQDVVCAGMSTLFVTTAEMILAMDEDGLVADKVIRLDPGNVCMGLMPTEAGRDKAEWLFQTLETGCRILAESYPEYVSIETA